MPNLARVFAYHGLGRIQALVAALANRGRSVPRDYRAYDVSKLLRAQRVARHLRERDEILDVGCGNGHLLRDLGLFRSLQRRAGIDLHVPNAPEPGIEVAAYDGQQLPFADGSFDAVIFGYFLHYLTRQHALTLLREGCRVARRDLFILDDSLPEWGFWYRLRNRLERLRSDILYAGISGGLYRGAGNEEMYLTHREWTTILQGLPGAESVEVEQLDRVSGLVHHCLFHVRLGGPGAIAK
jgi:SAM-dependent methyltransferase